MASSHPQSYDKMRNFIQSLFLNNKINKTHSSQSLFNDLIHKVTVKFGSLPRCSANIVMTFIDDLAKDRKYAEFCADRSKTPTKKKKKSQQTEGLLKANQKNSQNLKRKFTPFLISLLCLYIVLYISNRKEGSEVMELLDARNKLKNAPFTSIIQDKYLNYLQDELLRDVNSIMDSDDYIKYGFQLGKEDEQDLIEWYHIALWRPIAKMIVDILGADNNRDRTWELCCFFTAIKLDRRGTFRVAENPRTKEGKCNRRTWINLIVGGNPPKERLFVRDSEFKKIAGTPNWMDSFVQDFSPDRLPQTISATMSYADLGVNSCSHQGSISDAGNSILTLEDYLKPSVGMVSCADSDTHSLSENGSPLSQECSNLIPFLC